LARERRADAVALILALVAHVVVITYWHSLPIPASPYAAAGPRAAGPMAAPGSGMQALNLDVPPPTVIVPPRVPLITIDLTDSLDLNPAPAMDFSALPGLARGMGEGLPGLPGGRGRGDGGTGGAGLFRMVPPSPRGMIIPPTNARLRGSQVEVWVFVDAAGRVVPDSTRLNPPTSDRGFNRRLIEEAAEWVFNPALQAGQPVAAWFPYKISM
jgi:hypothetical protein